MNSGKSEIRDPRNSGNFFEKMTQKKLFLGQKIDINVKFVKKFFQKFDMFLSLMNNKINLY